MSTTKDFSESLQNGVHSVNVISQAMSVELSDPLLPSLWPSPMVGVSIDIRLTVTRTAAVQNDIPSVTFSLRFLSPGQTHRQVVAS